MCRGFSLAFASERLRAARGVVEVAVRRSGWALQCAAGSSHRPGGRRATRLALRHAASLLRDDEEIILAAVSETGCALEFATPRLRATDHVVLAAMLPHGMALRFASEKTSRRPFLRFPCRPPRQMGARERVRLWSSDAPPSKLIRRRCWRKTLCERKTAQCKPVHAKEETTNDGV